MRNGDVALGTMFCLASHRLPHLRTNRGAPSALELKTSSDVSLSFGRIHYVAYLQFHFFLCFIGDNDEAEHIRFCPLRGFGDRSWMGHLRDEVLTMNGHSPVCPPHTPSF